MALTFEITFVEDDILDKLDEDDGRISSIMFSEDRPSVSLGRAWHIIHALLTGSADKVAGPLSFMISGGRELSRERNGGWVCAYSSSDVAKIRSKLPSADALEKRYATDGLPDRVLYADRVETQGAEYFLEVYRELIERIGEAADEDQGMLAGLI
jgi:hypothetical protein